jgi:hypothetical protein
MITMVLISALWRGDINDPGCLPATPKRRMIIGSLIWGFIWIGDHPDSLHVRCSFLLL